jgi:rubrerythrin
METKTPLGRNRTGVQMSPFDTKDMLAGSEQFAPDTRRPREDAQVRLDYADETEGLGSVPMPGTVTGMLASGFDMVTGKRPQVLIDKLGERLAFERSGTRLYESLLVKCQAAPTALPDADQAALQRFRDEEHQHMGIVADALESLGADPTAQTPCADLVGVEGMGLVQAMNDPRTSLVQSLHVMLDAELIDNAGWDMLIELCRETGHTSLAEQFELAAEQEAEHLTHLRELVGRLTLQDAKLLGGTGSAASDGSEPASAAGLAVASATGMAAPGIERDDTRPMPAMGSTLPRDAETGAGEDAVSLAAAGDGRTHDWGDEARALDPSDGSTTGQQRRQQLDAERRAQGDEELADSVPELRASAEPQGDSPSDKMKQHPAGTAAGGTAGAAAGAVAGMAAGPVGSLAGAAVGALAGGMAGSGGLGQTGPLTGPAVEGKQSTELSEDAQREEEHALARGEQRSLIEDDEGDRPAAGSAPGGREEGPRGRNRER